MFLEDGGGLPIDNKLHILSLDCHEFSRSGIILEHVDHIVEVNEGVDNDSTL
jgi:hypothetical protein